MATEDRVKVLEGEFKLIKSELRQTLGSVRDFLLDLKLPPMQEEPGTIQESINGAAESGAEIPQQPEDTSAQDGFGGSSENGGSGDGSSQPQDQMPDFSNLGQPAEEQTPASEEEPQSEGLPPLDFGGEEEEGISSGDMPGVTKDRDEEGNTEEEGVDAGEPVDNLEDEPAGQGKGGIYQATTPQVNMLANIIRWVSTAKREIGSAQLSVFLDVYATTGSLSEEMKEIILHLAEVATNPSLSDDTPENGQVISEQLKLCMEINRSSGQLPDEIKLKIQRLTELLLLQSISYNKADVWSKLLVDLHGILTGGGSTVRSLQSIAQSMVKHVEEQKAGEEDKEIAGAEQESSNDLPPTDEDKNIFYEEPARDSPNMLRGTRPARLRLIMPVGEGDEQELDLGNLFIATDGINRPSNPKKANLSRK